MKENNISIDGYIIKLSEQNKENYLSLTDIAKNFGDDTLIYNWMRNRNTVEFLGVWESMHNPNFKSIEFETFKKEAGLNSFSLTPKKWITATAAIGFISKAGRYGGGTYAHLDIALEFCSWISPVFRLYIVKEFQRLKEIEYKQKQESLDWDVKRMLTKANYHLHTQAVKEFLIEPQIKRTSKEQIIYATEADLLNLALFQMTAKEWREKNPNEKGNIRDHASANELLVLANLENMNAKLIEWELERPERFAILQKMAADQLKKLYNFSNKNIISDIKIIK